MDNRKRRERTERGGRRMIMRTLRGAGDASASWGRQPWQAGPAAQGAAGRNLSGLEAELEVAGVRRGGRRAERDGHGDRDRLPRALEPRARLGRAFDLQLRGAGG